MLLPVPSVVVWVVSKWSYLNFLSLVVLDGTRLELAGVSSVDRGNLVKKPPFFS